MKLAPVIGLISAWFLLCAAESVRADEEAAIAALRQAGFKLSQTAQGTEIGFGQPEWTPASEDEVAQFRRRLAGPKKRAK